MSLKLSSDQLDMYNKDGYIILRNYFEEEDLKDWEEANVRFYAFQASKVPHLREKLWKGTNPADYTTVEDLDKLLYLFEEFDKKAGFYANSMVRYTKAGKQLTSNPKLLEVASQILGCPQDFVIIPDQTPSILTNLPSKVATSKRLVYHWHSERASYPKRRNFLTFWFPVFRNKDATNGTMYFRKGSHVKHHDHAEFRGFDDDSFNMKDALIQNEVPDYELTDFEEVPMEVERGDLVLFVDNLVHRGSVNTTDHISYTTIIRTFDYSRDLTLSFDVNSGKPGADLYSRKGILPVDFGEQYQQAQSTTQVGKHVGV